jgi:hypothetical protein
MQTNTGGSTVNAGSGYTKRASGTDTALTYSIIEDNLIAAGGSITASATWSTTTSWTAGIGAFFAANFTITGNAGVAGATINYSGASSGSVVADVSGNYTVTSSVNGVYTITPSLAGYTFTPTSQNVNVVSANVSGVNFTATAADDATIPFLGSVSETTDDSGGTNYVGHVKVVIAARSGVPNPYLGKIKKVTSVPGNTGDPLLGEVVIVSGPPVGFAGTDIYLGHAEET